MKHFLKKILKRLAGSMLAELEPVIGPYFNRDEVAAQKVLMQQYRLMASKGIEWLPNIRDTGFRKYSQFEEDGILLYLFSIIPPINRTCVEICAGNGRECNTTNLILNHGWWGHLFDGSEKGVADGRAFFSQHKDTFLYPPRFTKAWITAENVNEQIAQSGVSGPIDLLSLDIDGMDYWIWKAVTVIEPQVVVCETHNPIPPDRALTVPYHSGFIAATENFRGASLAAMCKLGKQKGYRLVGAHRYGFNAFFIKTGIAEAVFPEVDAASCVKDPYSELARKVRWPQAKDLNWQEV